MTASLNELDLGTDPVAFVRDTALRFASNGLLRLMDLEPIVYPIDIRPYSHLVTTRGGIYAFNETAYRCLDSGMFFGLCIDDEDNYLYYEFPHIESSVWNIPFNKAKTTTTNEGVIKSFTVRDGFVSEPSRATEGLGNNCHYLSYDGGTLYVVDTEIQAVWVIDPDGSRSRMPVFDPMSYHHINTIALHKGARLVMKCIRSKNDCRSGIGVFDAHWQLLREIDLPGERAHDLLLDTETADPEFWYCDSNNAHIRHYPTNRAIPVKSPVPGNTTTRGLSETEQCWVVGSGRYGVYDVTADKPVHLGAVSFIDKQSGRLAGQVLIPEAPCCIVRNPWHRRDP